MAPEQSPICPNEYINSEGKTTICMNYMLEYPNNPGYLKCSCGYSVKIIKRIIRIVGGETNEPNQN